MSSYVAALPDNKIKKHHHKTLCLPHFYITGKADDKERKETTRENGGDQRILPVPVSRVFAMVYPVLPTQSYTYK